MRGIDFTVAGYPPAKNEAKSILAAGHMYADRVLVLLQAAREAVGEFAGPLFPTEPLALEVVLETPAEPPSDAPNYLGEIADVLEAKAHRGVLEHLGGLVSVALYSNDRQLREVHYRLEQGAAVRYRARLWALARSQSDGKERRAGGRHHQRDATNTQGQASDKPEVAGHD